MENLKTKGEIILKQGNIRVVAKIIISLILFIVIDMLMRYYEPSIGGNIAVKQLEDSYSSSANVKMWQEVKNNWFLGYIVLVVFIFINDIKRLFKNKTNKGDK